jgi:hypothetical protein
MLGRVFFFLFFPFFFFVYLFLLDRRDRDRMVFGFTATCALSSYHH